MKVCNKCKLEKSLTDFHQRSGRGGVRSVCKDCHQSYHRKWKYGLDDELYQKMLELQKGKCLICDRRKKLYVDHNHITGQVRGLLCQNCNTALGMLEDDPIALNNALNYITKWYK